MSKQWIMIIIAVIIAGAAGAYYLIVGKPKSPLEEKEDELKKSDPSLTDEEARALAAAELAAEALRIAQEAERQALLEEQAKKLRLLEEELAAAQARAILLATEEAAREAAAIEAAARAERLEFERRSRQALSIVEAELVVIREAAVVAANAYVVAKGKADNLWGYVQTQQHSVARQQKVVNELGFWTTYWTRDREEKELASRKTSLVYLQGQYSKAVDAAAITRTAAAKTVSDANDCIERALTLIADIRLAGILFALCGRVDSIAKATRTKVAELEAKLG